MGTFLKEKKCTWILIRHDLRRVYKVCEIHRIGCYGCYSGWVRMLGRGIFDAWKETEILFDERNKNGKC